jgi:stage V sporulation protein K
MTYVLSSFYIKTINMPGTEIVEYIPSIVDGILIDNTLMDQAKSIISQEELMNTAKIYAEELDKQYKEAQSVADSDKKIYEDKKTFKEDMHDQCKKLDSERLDSFSKVHAEHKELVSKWQNSLFYYKTKKPSLIDYLALYHNQVSKSFQDWKDSNWVILNFDLTPLKKKANESMAIATELKSKKDLAWQAYNDTRTALYAGDNADVADSIQVTIANAITRATKNSATQAADSDLTSKMTAISAIIETNYKAQEKLNELKKEHAKEIAAVKATADEKINASKVTTSSVVTKYKKTIDDLEEKLSPKTPKDPSLEGELSTIIGQEDLKKKIYEYKAVNLVTQEMIGRGLQDKNAKLNHIMLKGNPGTGKTTIARLLGKLLHNMGRLKNQTFIEVQREDLVASYVGQTQPKTRKIINSAKGGILFIDEAYTLVRDEFGREAIEELMKDLNSGDPLVIIAGYANDMGKFLESNSGLPSRFQEVFNLSNYTVHELSDIFIYNVKAARYKLSKDIMEDTDYIATVIDQNTSPYWRSHNNGRSMENLLTKTREALSSRVSKKDIKKLSDDELTTIEKEDFEAGIKMLA